MKETEDIEKPDPDADMRLRAEARAVLDNPDRLPVLVLQYVSAQRDEDGNLISPICDAERAILCIAGVPDRHYTREASETLEDFKKRVMSDLPIRDESRDLWADRGGPGLATFLVILLPREESHDPQGLAIALRSPGAALCTPAACCGDGPGFLRIGPRRLPRVTGSSASGVKPDGLRY
jgi:hypothetical protein